MIPTKAQFVEKNHILTISCYYLIQNEFAVKLNDFK